MTSTLARSHTSVEGGSPSGVPAKPVDVPTFWRRCHLLPDSKLGRVQPDDSAVTAKRGVARGRSHVASRFVPSAIAGRVLRRYRVAGSAPGGCVGHTGLTRSDRYGRIDRSPPCMQGPRSRRRSRVYAAPSGSAHHRRTALRHPRHEAIRSLRAGVELEQRVAIWPALGTHSAEAARRSGLTCSSFRAPDENSATSLPSRFVAALEIRTCQRRAGP